MQLTTRPGNGPFIWLGTRAPDRGFRQLPEGGMCLSVFVFVRQGEKILLGRYADHKAWEDMAGLDQNRCLANCGGWTLPGRQLKFGEDPRDAGRDICERILGISRLRYGEPRVETDSYEARVYPGAQHFDVWFLIDSEMAAGNSLVVPLWYSALEWHDPAALPKESYARGHEDVVERWLRKR